MKSKLEKLLYILVKLDRGERLDVKSLSEELKVSERSVFRYLNNLIEAGFPIIYDPSRKSYTFEKGFSLRKSFLYLEELLLLYLSKSYLRKVLGEEVEKYFENLMKRFIKTCEEDVSEYAIFFQEQGFDKDLLPLFRELIFAIKEKEIVEIEYQKRQNTQPEKREIEPYYLFYALGFWYLLARCRRSDKMRTFALDKMRSVRRTGKYFILRKEEMIPPERVEETFGPSVDSPKVEVIARFSPEVKEYFLRKKWVKEQAVKELENGWIEVSFKIRGIGIFKKWLYSWIPHVRIIKPETLREEFERDLQKVLNNL